MSYSEALSSAIRGWKSEPIEDEWLFENFRETCVGRLSPTEAFEAIPITVDFLLLESDPSTVVEILQTIIDLADRSDTTECPRQMLERLHEINIKFSNMGEYAQKKLKELYKYYRLQVVF